MALNLNTFDTAIRAVLPHGRVLGENGSTPKMTLVAEFGQSPKLVIYNDQCPEAVPADRGLSWTLTGSSARGPVTAHERDIVTEIEALQQYVTAVYAGWTRNGDGGYEFSNDALEARQRLEARLLRQQAALIEAENERPPEVHSVAVGHGGLLGDLAFALTHIEQVFEKYGLPAPYVIEWAEDDDALIGLRAIAQAAKDAGVELGPVNSGSDEVIGFGNFLFRSAY